MESHARPHLPRELGSSRSMRQYIELRGGARLYPPVYAGRTRDNVPKERVLVLQWDAQPSTKPPKSVTFGGPAGNREPRDEGRREGFRWQA